MGETQRVSRGDGGLVGTQLGCRRHELGSDPTSPVVCSSVEMQLEIRQRNSDGEHRIQPLPPPSCKTPDSMFVSTIYQSCRVEWPAKQISLSDVHW